MVSYFSLFSTIFIKNFKEMKSVFRNYFKRIIYSQNWNIGFTTDTPFEVAHNKGLSKIKWLKHSYSDRWFADPFIVKETHSEIVVFAEELEIERPKGRLVELHIDRTNFRLQNRFVLLELDTHLSFPAFFIKDGLLYVYPENGESGSLKLYLYDEHTHSLSFVKELIQEALSDAIIVQYNSGYYLFATQSDSSQNGTLLYYSDSIDGHYMCINNKNNPFEKGINKSRSAGNIFLVDNCLFRPVQDCTIRYGHSINIMKLNISMRTEEEYLKIKPQSLRYNLGMHTINFGTSFCVVDGYGYLYSILGRLYYSRIVSAIKKVIRK